MDTIITVFIDNDNFSDKIYKMESLVIIEESISQQYDELTDFLDFIETTGNRYNIRVKH